MITEIALCGVGGGWGHTAVTPCMEIGLNTHFSVTVVRGEDSENLQVCVTSFSDGPKDSLIKNFILACCNMTENENIKFI